MAAVEFTSLVGITLDKGSLLLVDILGSGHSGVVYRALDLTTPEPHAEYAVKCLSNVKQSTQRDNEIRMHSAVTNHPNVLSIHRIIETDEFVFLVMDLCMGGDLWAAVTDRHVYWQKDELVRSAFMQLVDAIEYCHSRGVYHRDIKLENILCSKDGSKVWLADFGLATTEPLSYQFGVGTQYYISPESIAGTEHRAGPYSPAHNDVWSLGVVMLNMITGLCAWNTASMHDDHFRRYLNPDSNHLRSMLPISREADLLIRRVLCVNPWQRISLAQLKKDIMNVKTFFLTDVDIMLATDRVRSSAATQQTPWIHIPPPQEVTEQNNGDADVDSSSSYSRSSGEAPHHELVVTNPSLSTVDLSSVGSAEFSREHPTTAAAVDIPVARASPEEKFREEWERWTTRPELKERRSTKIMQGASRKFQAVMTKIRGQ